MPETAQLMHTRVMSPDPALNGHALGFYETYINGRRIIGHGGDTGWFHSVLSLMPESGLGLFASVRPLRSYAGLRPFSPDHLPLIGPIGPPGLFVASGHEGAGICESSATGLLISQWVTGQPTALPGDWYDPRRFTHESRVESLPAGRGTRDPRLEVR